MWIIYLIGVLAFVLLQLLCVALLRYLPPGSRTRRIGELVIALLGLALVTALFWSY